jgi:hypothetical protein
MFVAVVLLIFLLLLFRLVLLPIARFFKFKRLYFKNTVRPTAFMPLNYGVGQFFDYWETPNLLQKMLDNAVLANKHDGIMVHSMFMAPSFHITNPQMIKKVFFSNKFHKVRITNAVSMARDFPMNLLNDF